ncbi:TRAP transporter permease [Chloroflexota bacterium]
MGEDSISESAKEKKAQPSQLVTIDITRYQYLPKAIRVLVLAMSTAGVILAVLYAFGLARIGNNALIDNSYYYILFGTYGGCAFLLMAARKKDKHRAPWFDYILGALTFGIGIFFSTHGWEIRLVGWVPPPNILIFLASFIFVLLALEGGRRIAGLPFLIMVVLIGSYPMIADHMPGLLWGLGFPFQNVIGLFVFSDSGMVGIPGRVMGDILIGFLVFAGVLIASGAGGFFLDLAQCLLGKYRGGPAKVAVVASGFFGSLSGSVYANIAGTGSFTIPAMKRLGYPSEYAGAIEACASTGGPLMPPVMGGMAFIMAVMLNVEYAVIMVAALIPGLLYYMGLLMQVDAYAGKVGLRGLPVEEIPDIKAVMKRGWPFITVLIFLVWGLVYMRWEMMAPYYASALMIVLSYTNRYTMLTPRKILDMLLIIARLIITAMAVILPLGIIIAGLTVTGATLASTAALINVAGGNVFVLLLIGMAIAYVIGMAGLGAYIFLAITLAPALVSIGGLNELAVHLFIIYFSMLAMITPPVAVGAFLAAGMADGPPLKTAFTAMRLGVVIYFVPFFFVFNPALVLEGPVWESIYLFALAAIGVFFVAAGMEGYMLKLGKISFWTRPPYVIAGVLIGYPDWPTTYIGAAIAIFLTVILLMARKQVTENVAATGQ